MKKNEEEEGDRGLRSGKNEEEEGGGGIGSKCQAQEPCSNKEGEKANKIFFKVGLRNKIS